MQAQHLLLALYASLQLTMTAHASPTLAAIDYPLDAQVGKGSWSVDHEVLTLTAAHGTNMYASSDGKEIDDDTARVMFKPLGDFIFSAKVTGPFKAQYDGAALLVYRDRTHWAKLLFEKGYNGKLCIWSTVTKEVGDGVYHTARAADTLYLKVARQKDMFVFYTSDDGQQWQMIRTFGMPAGSLIKVGFSVQSPNGEQFAARYSEISLRSVSFTDYWNGL